MMTSIVDVTSHLNGGPTEPSSTDILRSSNTVAAPVSPASIRHTTPPSELCPSSPEFLPSSNLSERVRTRVDSPPPALALLAAICSSPSVHWDGNKHRYVDSEQSKPCDTARADREVTNSPRVIDPSTLPPSSDYGEHPYPFGHGIMGDGEVYRDPGLQKPLAAPELHCAILAEDVEDYIPTPRLSAGSDYTSDFLPSSPTAHSFSSPSYRMSCDFTSSSERSITLPLSSPAPSYLKKTISSPALHTIHTSMATHDAPIQEKRLEEDQTPQEVQVECLALKAEPLDVPMPQAERTEVRLDGPRSGFDSPTRSLSPLHAPSPLFADPILSPMSSVMSSPLSEPFDLEPPSAVSSHFSVSSSVVSSRSTSPLTDMGDDGYPVKPASAGRRASTNVIGTPCRRMSGGMSKELPQRSDTAPPEPTPRKRRRRSSPSSPVLRAFQVQRVSSPRSPSCSKGTATSSAGHQENLRPFQKSRMKAKKSAGSASALSRSNRVAPRTDAHRPPLGSKLLPLTSSSNTEAALDSTLPNPNNLSMAELATLPVTGFLVETLALSRASAMAAPELLRAVLKSQPHLLEERSRDRWSDLVRCILEQVRMFGRIERRGTDAADRPLEDQWFYIPENDEEDGRAELLKGLMPNKRSVTKRSKQYYFEPVQKVTRWDPEDD